MWLRKADAVTGVILVLVGLGTLVAVLSFRWDLASVQRAGWYTAPGIVPAAVGMILMAQGVSLTMQAVRNGGRWRSADLLHVADALRSPAARRVGLVALLLSVYVFGLVGRIHFTAASFLFLAVFMFAFKAGAWWKILVISGAAALAISFAFQDLARVPLP